MPFALAFGDGLTGGPDLMRSLVDVGRTPVPDRRKRLRVSLAWAVYFCRPTDTHPIEGQTKNISSEGLYCLITQPFAVGEMVGYTLIMPAFNQERPHYLIRLAGEAEVLRFEPVGPGMYGLACRVRDYKILPSDLDP